MSAVFPVGDTQRSTSRVLSTIQSRSVRETVTDDEWKASEEEEDFDQEMYIESILQRIIYIRSTFRTDSGSFLLELFLDNDANCFF